MDFSFPLVVRLSIHERVAACRQSALRLAQGERTGCGPPVANGHFPFPLVANGHFPFPLVANGHFPFPPVANGHFPFPPVANGHFPFPLVVSPSNHERMVTSAVRPPLPSVISSGAKRSREI